MPKASGDSFLYRTVRYETVLSFIMPDTIRILAFAGSLRHGSFNQKLVNIAASGAVEADAIVTVIHLKDFPMPIYNGDDEAVSGLPEHAVRFKKLIAENDGLIIASPEYNGAPSAALKNALDWASRSQEEGEPPAQAFRGKFAAVIAASPGGLGGIRGLPYLREVLTSLGVTTIPAQMTLPVAHEAFDNKDMLVDPRKLEQAKAIGRKLVDALR